MRRICIAVSCVILIFFKSNAKGHPVKASNTEIQNSAAAGSLNPDSAQLTVSGLFQSNMVIQRDKPTQLWGTAAPDATVRVKASWYKKKIKVKAGSNGNWLVLIPGTAANASPQTLTISTRHVPTIKMDNILIGEVWVCSGQSNMVMWMGYANIFLQGVINYEAEIARANHPTLRYLEIEQNDQPLPQDYIPIANIKKWSVCTPDVARQYSGLAYYFGWKLDSTLNVPVGLVVSAVGATAIDRWTSKESAQTDSVLIKYYSHFDRLSTLYNGMIYPLKNLAIKGFIWDQGESNEYDLPASHYTNISKAMITQWRSIFNQGNLPFYFVQMTPTKFPTGNDYFYALFREAQANARSLPNTRMAVTMDIDETNNIHYRNKKISADRLAALALHYDYGLPVAADGPSYKSFTQKDSTIIITFNNASGLKTTGPLAQVFTVAGDDHVFCQANAVISGNTIILTVPKEITAVIAVRYAFTNTAVSRLYNGDGMPMEPFRTDNW